MTKIAIITVCYNSNVPLARLANSLENQITKPWIWLVIDNAPLSKPAIKPSTTFPSYILSANEGDGFGPGCNTGIEYLCANNFLDWIWLLNPDTCLTSSTHIEGLLSILNECKPNTLLGTRIEGSADQLEPSAGWIYKGLDYRSAQISDELFIPGSCHGIEVDWLSGCNLLFRPSDFSKPLRFDPYFLLYFEDIDLCLRAKAHGGKCIWINCLSISHQKSTGSNCSTFRRERLKAVSQIRFLIRYQPSWVIIAHTFRIVIQSLPRLFIHFDCSCGRLYGVYQALISASFKGMTFSEGSNTRKQLKN